MKLPPLLERRIIESLLYASETVSNKSLFLLFYGLEILRVELVYSNHGHPDKRMSRLGRADWLHF